MKVRKGGDPSHPKEKATPVPDPAEMVNKAYADPGEWYSIPLEGASTASANTVLTRVITKKVAEISTKGGRLWVKFYA
jgi:hypothetical protein